MHAPIFLLAVFSLLSSLLLSTALPLHINVHHSRSRVERIKRHHHHSHSSQASPSSTSSSASPSSTSGSDDGDNNDGKITSAGTYLAPAPRWVTYSDADIDGGNTVVPSASQLNGVNVFLLAFYLNSGPSDQLQNFISLPSSKRQDIIDDLHSHGISLGFSVFGSTEAPTTDGVDPESFAGKVASFAKKYKFDVVDTDYEDFDAFNSGSSEAVNWLVSFSKALRSHLPSGQYLLSHAPVAPWLTDSKDAYPGGSYLDVTLRAGDAIDFLNMQFYNQDNLYSSCNHIVKASPSGSYPHTSISEIHKNGVPLEKLVIGKPALASDADGSGDQGFMSGSSLQQCVNQAKEELGWNAGMMLWEYHHSTISSLLSTVRSVAFPILGSL
jgi:chitinase